MQQRPSCPENGVVNLWPCQVQGQLFLCDEYDLDPLSHYGNSFDYCPKIAV